MFRMSSLRYCAVIMDWKLETTFRSLDESFWHHWSWFCFGYRMGNEDGVVASSLAVEMDENVMQISSSYVQNGILTN